MIDLRDCPFCGGQADVIVKLPLYGFSGVVIKCRYCGAKIENCKGHEQIHEEEFMAEAFVPNPNNFPVVNHKDEDGTNNLLSNIEWCDKSYNASYGSSPSKISKAFKGRASEKRIPVQKLKNGLIVGEYPCAGDAEKATGISMANIRLVCRGKRKLAGGYAWRYCGCKMDAKEDEA